MKSSKFGIGIDIVDIRRFKKLPYTTHKKFYQRIFDISEINYCLKFKDPYTHFAGKFAIKEATRKSISDNINLLNIKTGHFNSKPVISIKGKEQNFFVSVSHEHNIAIAVVISEHY